MKHASYSLTLGVALMAAGVVSSHAADWAVGSGGAFGSVKDYRNAAVPVPAPSPMPTPNKDWYIRGDFGYNFATNADIGTTGAVTSSDPGQNLDGFLFGSVGFGRYITPNMRAELSLDYRPARKVTSGVQSSTKVETVAGPVNGLGNPTTYTKTYSILQQDDAKSYDQNVFFNLYYDFARSGRFTPYIGAGIGVDARRFKRTSSQRATCVSATLTDPDTIPTTNPVACPAGYGHANAYFAHDDKDSFAYGVAAAVMLGTSYELAPGFMIDSGYRLVWQGAEAELSGRGLFESTAIRISDKFEHEWRTGIRLDLN